MDLELLSKMFAESRQRFGKRCDPQMVQMENKLLHLQPFDTTELNLKDPTKNELYAEMREKEAQLQKAVLDLIYAHDVMMEAEGRLYGRQLRGLHSKL
ncbi:hypothetical protein SFRURICE_007300 [Spodoptera frugiperda]|nr:hypothetical protein SFRURICE_007300 [Spodoptera frugiperda]